MPTSAKLSSKKEKLRSCGGDQSSCLFRYIGLTILPAAVLPLFPAPHSSPMAVHKVPREKSRIIIGNRGAHQRDTSEPDCCHRANGFHGPRCEKRLERRTHDFKNPCADRRVEDSSKSSEVCGGSCKTVKGVDNCVERFRLDLICRLDICRFVRRTTGAESYREPLSRKLPRNMGKQLKNCAINKVSNRRSSLRQDTLSRISWKRPRSRKRT